MNEDGVDFAQMTLEQIAQADRSWPPFNGHSVYDLRRVAFLVGQVIASSAIGNLLDRPLHLWQSSDIHALVQAQPHVLLLLDLLIPHAMTHELVDLAYDGHHTVSMLPRRFQRAEHWLKELCVATNIRQGEIPAQVNCEAFWLRAMELTQGRHPYHRLIPMASQTEAIAYALVTHFGAEVSFQDLRSDVLSPRVAGTLMQHRDDLDMVDEEILLAGMRWLMQGGYPSLLAQRVLDPQHRSQAWLWSFYDEGRCRGFRGLDYYQVVEELRQFPPGESAPHVNSDDRLALFRKLHGPQVAIKHLGEQSAPYKRQWLSEDMGL